MENAPAVEPAADAVAPVRRLSSIIFRNAAFITLGLVAMKGLGFLFNVYVIRQLGDDRFGQYSIVLGFVGLFQVFLEFGMTQYVMREIAQDRSLAPRLLWDLMAIRFVLALVGMVGITAAGALFGYSTEIVLGIFIYSVSFLLAAFLAPLSALLTSHERFDYTTALEFVGRLLFFALGGFFLLQGMSYVSLIAANIIPMPIMIGAALWLIHRHRMVEMRPRVDIRRWPALMRAGMPFGVISLFLTIAFSIDTVMLSRYESDQVVGWYNVAYGLIPSLLFVFGGFKTAMVPSLARTYVAEPMQVNRWYHRSVRFIAIVSLPIAVGGTLVAFPLIRFLYTDEFLPAALALQILIWDVPFLMFASFCGNMTTVIGEERAAARVYGINTAANVILNLYAIPRYGLVGAALVTVVTDLIGALQFYLLLRGRLKLPPMAGLFLRVTIASLGMGAVVWMAGPRNLLLLIVLGASSYAGMALVMRLLDEEEWRLIRRLLRRLNPFPNKGTAG